MGYVAVSPAARVTRLELATSRWNQILVARPDLEPAVALQRELIGLVVDGAELVEHGRLPRLSLPPRYVAAKLGNGIPALTGEPVPVPVPVLRPTLMQLCGALERGGAGNAAAHIRATVEEGRMDAASLLTASLRREQHAIRAARVPYWLRPGFLLLGADVPRNV